MPAMMVFLWLAQVGEDDVFSVFSFSEMFCEIYLCQMIASYSHPQMFWLRHSIVFSCVAAVFMGWFSALSAMVNHHDAR